MKPGLYANHIAGMNASGIKIDMILFQGKIKDFLFHKYRGTFVAARHYDRSKLSIDHNWCVASVWL